MEDTPDVTPEQQRAQQGLALTTKVVRGMGALFMLGGAAIGSNFSGIAETLGLFSNGFEKILGGALFALGVFDYFLLPVFLQKAFDRRKS